MTTNVQDNILTSLLFQRIGKEYLELTKHEVNGDGKRFLNILIQRLNANLNDCYVKITSQKGRDMFAREFSQKDMLLYANVFTMILECDEEKRSAIEKLITAIHKGDAVEFVER